MHLLVNHTIYVVDEYFISRQRDNNKYISIKVIGNRYLLQVFSLFHAVELHIRNAIWWLSGNHYMNQKYPQDIHLFCYGWKVVYQFTFWKPTIWINIIISVLFVVFILLWLVISNSYMYNFLERIAYYIQKYKYYSIRLPYIYLMKIYQPFNKINTHFAKWEDKAKLTPRVIDYF